LRLAALAACGVDAQCSPEGGGGNGAGATAYEHLGQPRIAYVCFNNWEVAGPALASRRYFFKLTFGRAESETSHELALQEHVHEQGG
jgi:hypothetical protein